MTKRVEPVAVTATPRENLGDVTRAFGQCFPGGRSNPIGRREENVRAAYARGASLESLMKNYGIDPPCLFATLGLDRDKLWKEYQTLCKRWNELRDIFRREKDHE